MKPMYPMLAGFLLAVTASPSTAQSGTGGGGGSTAGDPAAGKTDSMREDTTVFQLLLSRGLGRHYGVTTPSGGGSTASCPAYRAGLVPPRPVGVYLKGHGVVYTVSLPTPASSPVAADTPPTDKPSEWDRTASELRGEKPTAEGKTSGSREESLSTTLMRMLAENGKHFRDLSADEKITVAVTFHGKGFTCTSCHSGGGTSMRGTSGLYGPSGGSGISGIGGGGSPLGHYSIPVTGQGSSGFSGGGGFAGGSGFSGGSSGGQTQPSGSTPGTTLEEAPSDVQSKVLLGDMHMKQGKYAEAVRKYTEAINALPASEKGTAKQRLQQLHIAIDIVNRTARAQLATGDNDHARTSLEAAARLTDRALKLASEIGKEDTSAKRALAPDQLIISAPKRLLDQVGSGKVTFDEFRKSVSVDYFHKD